MTNSQLPFSLRLLDLPFWKSPVRLAATILSSAAVVLATVVPIVLYHGNVRYDSSVAMDAITAIGALWAVVFAAENIQAFTEAAKAESLPILSATLHSDGEADSASVAIHNLGKGGAVLTQQFLWLEDVAGMWSKSPLWLKDPALRPQESIRVASEDIKIADNSKRDIAVEIRYRDAFATDNVLWLRFPKASVAPHLGEPLSEEPRLSALKALEEELKQKRYPFPSEIDARFDSHKLESRVSLTDGWYTPIPHSPFESVSNIRSYIFERAEALVNTERDWQRQMEMKKEEARAKREGSRA